MMSVAEIEKTKAELISWIERLSDVDMLDVLEGLKKTEEKEDWWDTLPESHRRNIMIGLEQAKRGQTMSSKDFWTRLKNE